MIRHPHPDERDRIIPLIRLIMEDMELPIFQHIDSDTFDQMMAEAMLAPNFRYSLTNTLVYIKDSQVAGAIFGYNGALEPTIDDAFHNLYSKYNIETTTTLYEDSETQPGEWYADIVAVYPEYRGHGIGTTLLKAAEDLAREDGATLIALNCEFENHNAHALYTHLGYETDSTRMLSGHPYFHMVKEV